MSDHCNAKRGLTPFTHATVLALGLIPAIYALVKEWRLRRGMESAIAAPAPTPIAP